MRAGHDDRATLTRSAALAILTIVRGRCATASAATALAVVSAARNDPNRMLKPLKDLFDALMPPAAAVESPADARQRLHLAAAVLLVEVMRADAELNASERSAVIATLQDKFAVTDDAVRHLIDLAHKTSNEAGDYFAFTSRINDGFTMEQKILLVEYMWRVAYSDGTLSAHENHLMRKVADLLHVPHGAYVHAKMRARPTAGEA